jgi:hypothetical protein
MYLFFQSVAFTVHKNIAFLLEDRFNEILGNIFGQPGVGFPVGRHLP